MGYFQQSVTDIEYLNEKSFYAQTTSDPPFTPYTTPINSYPQKFHSNWNINWFVSFQFRRHVFSSCPKLICSADQWISKICSFALSYLPYFFSDEKMKPTQQIERAQMRRSFVCALSCNCCPEFSSYIWHSMAASYYLINKTIAAITFCDWTTVCTTVPWTQNIRSKINKQKSPSRASEPTCCGVVLCQGIG